MDGVARLLPLTSLGNRAIAALQTRAKIGNKTCIADHWHYGDGAAGTMQEAQAQAFADWEAFTAIGYSTDWMVYKRGESRGMKCGKSGVGWRCVASVRVCRRS